MTSKQTESKFCTWYVCLLGLAPAVDEDEEKQQQQKKLKGGDFRQAMNHHGANGEHLSWHHRPTGPARYSQRSGLTSSAVSWFSFPSINRLSYLMRQRKLYMDTCPLPPLFSLCPSLLGGYAARSDIQPKTHPHGALRSSVCHGEKTSMIFLLVLF